MEFIDTKTLKSDRILSDLDKLVIRFIKILEKHSDYVIISGYVAILLGRSRGTDDVDIFIRSIDMQKFASLYRELKKEGFWCLNAEDEAEIYSYLDEGLAVRFAEDGLATPNFEVKFARKLLDVEAFNDRISVITELGMLKISSLERQVAYKRYYLKSDKDIEDAAHVEKLFKEHIDNDAIRSYKRRIENEVAKAGKG